MLRLLVANRVLQSQSSPSREASCDILLCILKTTPSTPIIAATASSLSSSSALGTLNTLYNKIKNSNPQHQPTEEEIFFRKEFSRSFCSFSDNKVLRVKVINNNNNNNNLKVNQSQRINYNTKLTRSNSNSNMKHVGGCCIKISGIHSSSKQVEMTKPPEMYHDWIPDDEGHVSLVETEELLEHESFSDPQLAYDTKTTSELAKSTMFYFLFRFPLFTDHAEKLLRLSRTVLGQAMSELLIKSLVYGQYVAGETNEEVKEVVDRMRQAGIGPLIAVPIEDDISNQHGPVSDQESSLDANLDTILKCINLAQEVNCTAQTPDPMIQLRITALASPALVKCLSSACTPNQGDENSLPSHNPSDVCHQTMSMLVSALKGEPLQIPQGDAWNEVKERMAEMESFVRRLQSIAERVTESGTVAMVDAEYTYFNPALRHVTLALMHVCNREKPLVFYTYQAYLKNTGHELQSDIELAKTKGFCFGAKLVRGAYIVKERSLAHAEGRPDPVNDSYDITSCNYQWCLDQLLACVRRDSDRTRFIVASHNEDSIRYAFKKMRALGVSKDSRSVLFGQLYGMADHVSYTLGKRGVNVVKSLPYGSVEDTIPYLSRRAQENRSIFDNVRKEKQLVQTALWDRLRLRGKGKSASSSSSSSSSS